MKKTVSNATREKLSLAARARWATKKYTETMTAAKPVGQPRLIAGHTLDSLRARPSASVTKRASVSARPKSVAPKAAWHVGDTASTIVRDLPNGQTFIVPEGFRIETISLSNNGALTRFTIATA